MKKRKNFTTGEKVRVAEYHKIKETLDANGCLEGLLFMENMRKLCGREFEISRKVKWVYDESSKKMLKCVDIYALRGAFCDGVGMLGGRNCDRCCTYLWKRAWLERLQAAR
jgi:hypothetical protein